MAELSSNYHTRLAKCLASRNRVEAASLLAEVRGAMAAGKASGPGFLTDEISLASIAGVPLDKAASGRSEPLQKATSRPALPPHLEALAKDAIARIEGASGRLEKADAMANGRAVQQRLDDFWRGLGAQTALQSAQRQPKSSRGT